MAAIMTDLRSVLSIKDHNTWYCCYRKKILQELLGCIFEVTHTNTAYDNKICLENIFTIINNYKYINISIWLIIDL